MDPAVKAEKEPPCTCRGPPSHDIIPTCIICGGLALGKCDECGVAFFCGATCKAKTKHVCAGKQQDVVCGCRGGDYPNPETTRRITLEMRDDMPELDYQATEGKAWNVIKKGIGIDDENTVALRQVLGALVHFAGQAKERSKAEALARQLHNSVPSDIEDPRIEITQLLFDAGDADWASASRAGPYFVVTPAITDVTTQFADDIRSATAASEACTIPERFIWATVFLMLGCCMSRAAGNTLARWWMGGISGKLTKPASYSRAETVKAMKFLRSPGSGQKNTRTPLNTVADARAFAYLMTLLCTEATDGEDITSLGEMLYEAVHSTKKS